MSLNQYLAKRHYWEFAGVVLIVTIAFVTTLSVEIIDQSRYGGEADLTEPLVLELSSHVAIGLTIPLLLWFYRLVPIRTETWERNLAVHLGFSVVFSLAHVILMYWARVITFRRLGSNYGWDDWPGEFGYEYLKDVRTYFLILAVVYLYHFILRRLQGEAGFLSDEADEKTATATSDRFLVKKLGREFLVRVDEIDWIESCGNYVNLHVGERVYPLRETMRRIDERLVPMGFQRVHRSAIVNLDRVSEIVAFDTGDGQAKLRTDVTVPVSRRFRQELRERLA